MTTPNTGATPKSFNNVHTPPPPLQHPSPASASKRPLHLQQQQQPASSHTRSISASSAALGNPMSRSTTNQSGPPTVAATAFSPPSGGGAVRSSAAAAAAAAMTVGSAGSPARGPLSVVHAGAAGAGGGNSTSKAGTPAQANAALGAMGLNMNIGMGMAMLTPAEQEAERRRRLDAITNLLGDCWGYVSPEGLERAARRCGLECLWEESMSMPGTSGTPEVVATPALSRRNTSVALPENGKRVLSVAGEGLLVEVEFDGQAVSSVGVDFPGSEWCSGSGTDDDATVQRDRAARVLRENLLGEGFVSLDAFADNLKRLARMDRLGGTELNCFDALQGVYTTLATVFRKELEQERQLWKKQAKARDGVRCAREGRPVMHARGRVGLALQYWKSQRQVERGSKPSIQNGDVAMDVEMQDGSMEDDALNDEDETSEDIWSAVIECEESSADLYTPARTSKHWVNNVNEDTLSNDLTDPLHIPQTNLKWLEPPDDIKSLPKGPDVRFVAKLEPPLAVPLQVALSLMQTVGSTVPQDTLIPVTYEAVLFADIDAQNMLGLQATPRSSTREVLSSATGDGDAHTHRTSLFTAPQDLGRAVTHLPFRHPMQITSLLPVMRQWALVASILRRACTSSSPSPSNDAPVTTTTTNGTNHDGAEKEEEPFQSLDEELAAFLSSSSPTNTQLATSASKPDITVEISFTTTPFPQFQLSFTQTQTQGQADKQPASGSVQFAIGPGGTFENVAVALSPSPTYENGKGQEELVGRVKRVLEISEDVGVAVEYLLTQQMGA